MAQKRKPSYTPEQVTELNANPYTHKATPYTVSFTLAFKEFFLEQVKVPGMTSRKIMKAAGYDPNIFPKGTLDKIRSGILAQAASPEGLKPPRGLSSAEKTAAFAAKDLAKQEEAKSIKELQERVVKLEVEIEFLKKTQRLRRPR